MNKTLVKRLAVVAVVGLLILLYWQLGLGQYLTLDYFQDSRARFADLYADHPLLVVGAYFLIYVAVAALALPAATLVTLAGGALFGFWVGTVTVSFASSIGASLAFLIARYLLRDWCQRRFGARLAPLNRGMEKDGPFYLFTIRLIPVFPFVAVNTLMGLTPIRLGTFYWVSQLGMLPATMVYVNAGSELGRLTSLSGLLTPRLLVSFALLGIFPLAVRKIMQWFEKRRRRP